MIQVRARVPRLTSLTFDYRFHGWWCWREGTKVWWDLSRSDSWRVQRGSVKLYKHKEHAYKILFLHDPPATQSKEIWYPLHSPFAISFILLEKMSKWRYLSRDMIPERVMDVGHWYLGKRKELSRLTNWRIAAHHLKGLRLSSRLSPSCRSQGTPSDQVRVGQRSV